jgi:RsiW-degrading membrane proteinase PrsW (M82 family)
MILVVYMFVGLAWGLAYYLLEKDKGEREPTGALWAAFGFGALALIPTGILEYFFTSDSLLEAAHTMPQGMIFREAMLVGIIEEACKFLPLAVFIYKKRYFNEHTDGIIYFALAGLGFGLPENIMYTLSYGGEALGRLVLTPFFHAATTAFVGYYLIRCKVRKRPLFTVAVALAAMMILHGLYDFGLMSGVSAYAIGSLAITISLSVFIFAVSGHAKTRDQKMGLSVVGHNVFCRSCGFPNPKRHLYCTRCGRHA